MIEYYDKKCKCNCGRKIEIKPHHKYYGTPEYIHGHNERGKAINKYTCACGCGQPVSYPKSKYIQGHNMRNPKRKKLYDLSPEVRRKINKLRESEKTLILDSTAILCLCGCGKFIEIQTYHKYRGIPKYILGHYVRVNLIKDAKVKAKERERWQTHFWKQHGIALGLYGKSNCVVCGKSEDELEFSLRIHPLGDINDMHESNWVSCCSECKGSLIKYLEMSKKEIEGE